MKLRDFPLHMEIHINYCGIMWKSKIPCDETHGISGVDPQNSTWNIWNSTYF